jgi:hypothetical protein
MRIAIVGSRRRTDPESVRAYVASLEPTDHVVSGGAAGPDTWATEAAAARGLPVTVHRPNLAGVRNRGEASGRYYARNQAIVDDADVVVAFVAPDRKGGTEDTVRRAQRAGKPVILK